MLWVRRVAPVLLAAGLVVACLCPAAMAMPMAMGTAPCGGTPAPRACCVTGGHTLATVAAPVLPQPLGAALLASPPLTVPALTPASPAPAPSPSPPGATAAGATPLRL